MKRSIAWATKEAAKHIDVYVIGTNTTNTQEMLAVVDVTPAFQDRIARDFGQPYSVMRPILAAIPFEYDE